MLKRNKSNPQKHSELLCEFYADNEKKYMEDNQIYYEGLLSYELLSYHLAVKNVQIDAKIVMNLLTCIEAGFTCQPEKSDKDYIFIPYLIEQKNCPVKSETLKDIMLTTDTGLSLCCHLEGNFPITFWSYLVVAIIIKLKLQRQTQNIWTHGFYATIGQKNAELYLQYTSPEQIDFYIKAMCDDKVGHKLIWKYVRIFNNECQRLLTEWWPGLITKKVLKCPVCPMIKIIQDIKEREDSGLSPAKKPCIAALSPAEFDLDELLLDEDEAEETCRCDNGCELPAALIKPLPKGLSLASYVFFIFYYELISLSIFRKKEAVFNIPFLCILSI